MSYEVDDLYEQDSYVNASADFDYDSDNPSFPDVCSSTGLCDEPTANGNAPNWQWTDDTSPSSSTGPPAANGGCTFPESSSDAAAGDICTATMKTANQINAGTYGLYVTVDTCVYGNAAATLFIEAWDGDSWEILDTLVGNATTTFASQGPYDCTLYTNSDFYVRIRVELATSGNVYHSDFAFQNLRIYGDSKTTYEIDGVTYNNSGEIEGSCDVYLAQDNGDNTISFIAHTTSHATTGVYSFQGAYSTADYIVIFFKDGATDLFDVTDHDIQGVEV